MSAGVTRPMKTIATSQDRRWDAPFWALLMIGVISLGSLGCFGLAATQLASKDAGIVAVDNLPPPADL